MEKYLQYEVAEFALDDDFISWVQSPEKEATLRWQSFLDQYPEKQETIDTAKALIQRISFEDENIPAGTQDAIWNNIKTKTTAVTEVAEKKSGVIRWLFPVISVAASVALLLFFFLPTANEVTLHRTDVAELKTQKLPDNSVVHINAESQISYDPDAWADGERTLHLDGEAFFEVEKGSKFTVLTKNGDVAVLGTSFNVYSRASRLQVECETGKVAVTDRAKQTTILTPGQAVEAIDGKAKQQQKSNARSDWRTKSYHYDNRPLSQVVYDLQRSFDINIKLDNQLSESKYTGNIEMTNLDSALYQITWPMRLELTKNGKQITLSKDK